jgi:hypothetical protein
MPAALRGYGAQFDVEAFLAGCRLPVREPEAPIDGRPMRQAISVVALTVWALFAVLFSLVFRDGFATSPHMKGAYRSFMKNIGAWVAGGICATPTMLIWWLLPPQLQLFNESDHPDAANLNARLKRLGIRYFLCVAVIALAGALAWARP